MKKPSIPEKVQGKEDLSREYRFDYSIWRRSRRCAKSLTLLASNHRKERRRTADESDTENSTVFTGPFWGSKMG
jgi:hypothetical protein